MSALQRIFYKKRDKQSKEQINKSFYNESKGGKFKRFSVKGINTWLSLTMNILKFKNSKTFAPCKPELTGRVFIPAFVD